MLLSRRTLLTGATASAAAIMLLRRNALAAVEHSYSLDLRPGTAKLMEDEAATTEIWGFNGTVPGPILHATQGRPVSVHVTNNLDQPTSVHWHGVRIENAMDGVPGLTQQAIEPGATFDYLFTPPDAGTYWYHPHSRSWEQVARGLYGMLVVDEAEKPDVDRDFLFAADDWRLEKDGAFDEASLGNLHDWAHAGRLGNTLTVNGKAYERFEAAVGERVRIRLLNAANARVLKFAIPDLKPWIVAHDGQPVTPEPAPEGGIELAPGQRTDLIVDVSGTSGDEIPIVDVSTGERLVAAYIAVNDDPATQSRGGDAPAALPPTKASAPLTGDMQEVNLTMTGGAMRFMESAVFKGEKLDGRTLALEHKQAWAFNGIAGMPSAPLFTARVGESVRIRMRNDTLWPHNIHLHGHHFIELARHKTSGGETAPIESPRKKALQDTVLLNADEAVEVALTADNPGKWMIHCHMLEHQASGMASWFEVV